MLHNNLGCNNKNFISNISDFTKEKIKNINILHEWKESRDDDSLLKASIEDNIDEDSKDVTLNHPFYYDEFKNTIEENIHNISIQQNDIKTNTTMKA
jgi:hypothetical protein